MKCEIARDLLPLYVDGICSEESKTEIEDHLEGCEHCRAELFQMKAELNKEVSVPIVSSKTRGKIGLLKASVLQTACMLAAFLVIVYGVYEEASIPSGLTNGIMAFWIVAPATGFLLSLMNWHFARFYESRRSFVISNVVLCVILTVCLWAWSINHYELFPAFASSVDALYRLFLLYFQRGLLFTAVLSAVLAGASFIYARLLGKE